MVRSNNAEQFGALCGAIQQQYRRNHPDLNAGRGSQVAGARARAAGMHGYEEGAAWYIAGPLVPTFIGSVLVAAVTLAVLPSSQDITISNKSGLQCRGNRERHETEVTSRYFTGTGTDAS